MDKTLGQIAFEARPCAGPWGERWEEYGEAEHSLWEGIASAVAAAVKEEDAMICKRERVVAIKSGPDGDFVYNNALDHAAAAIRASIKP